MQIFIRILCFALSGLMFYFANEQAKIISESVTQIDAVGMSQGMMFMIILGVILLVMAFTIRIKKDGGIPLRRR